MAYLHKYSIVHGFINSYSVLIDNKFKAKVGSLEYAEENGLETYHSVCSMTDNWMSPEQLCRQCPANMASDVYRSVYISFFVRRFRFKRHKLTLNRLTDKI